MDQLKFDPDLLDDQLTITRTSCQLAVITCLTRDAESMNHGIRPFGWWMFLPRLNSRIKTIFNTSFMAENHKFLHTPKSEDETLPIVESFKNFQLEVINIEMKRHKRAYIKLKDQHQCGNKQ